QISCRGVVTEDMIQTPRARSCRREIKEEETEDHRNFATVQHRKDATRPMRAEIRNGHLAGEDECGGFGEESDKKQESACHLQHSGNSQQREVRESGVRLAVWETKQLLRSVFEKKKCRDDSQDAE